MHLIDACWYAKWGSIYRHRRVSRMRFDLNRPSTWVECHWRYGVRGEQEHDIGSHAIFSGKDRRVRVFRLPFSVWHFPSIGSLQHRRLCVSGMPFSDINRNPIFCQQHGLACVRWMLESGANRHSDGHWNDRKILVQWMFFSDINRNPIFDISGGCVRVQGLREIGKRHIEGRCQIDRVHGVFWMQFPIINHRAIKRPIDRQSRVQLLHWTIGCFLHWKDSRPSQDDAGVPMGASRRLSRPMFRRNIHCRIERWTASGWRLDIRQCKGSSHRMQRQDENIHFHSSWTNHSSNTGVLWIQKSGIGQHVWHCAGDRDICIRKMRETQVCGVWQWGWNNRIWRVRILLVDWIGHFAQKLEDDREPGVLPMLSIDEIDHSNWSWKDRFAILQPMHQTIHSGDSTHDDIRGIRGVQGLHLVEHHMDSLWCDWTGGRLGVQWHIVWSDNICQKPIDENIGWIHRSHQCLVDGWSWNDIHAWRWNIYCNTLILDWMDWYLSRRK